ncbi:hypothetical protein PITCH_A140034 [uncultured Desulfobacterium sp.]|uniref:Uncharacterized protein n=1 Tax=uncultured Desulfobacterium sp. TaxID=201089 RepID=A0A445MSP9_9BACT|nr:hypothetical protein PITCH_A140034 [uncultured Desulfobacterium sp.]
MEWVSVLTALPKVELRITGFKPCLVVNDNNVQWALFNGKTNRFQDKWGQAPVALLNRIDAQSEA